MIDKKNFESIDQYIGSFPESVQVILSKTRKTIKSVLPKDIEEVISYGIPTFKLNGKYLIYYSAWKEHISIYPIPTGSAEFNKKLLPYVAGRGTLKFPFNKEIPYDLIKKIAEVSLKNRSESNSYGRK